MKKNNNLRCFNVILVFSILLITACKQGLDERQQLFLDYAKLEDRYHNTGFYKNLDLYNLNTEPIIYKDSAFNIENFKATVVKNFKIYAEDNEIQADLGYELQYPYQYVLTPQKDGSIHTKLSVFVPETYYKFSLSAKDIGKSILKDSVEISLLDMTNDGATLLVENKAERQSYDYTYDIFDRKDTSSKKEEYVLPKEPGYGDYLFHRESIERPNYSSVETKDSLSRASFARLEMSLVDETGKPLASQGRINDFRHYLWYRNHDMPYPELLSEYMDIKAKYKELDKDPLHKFHPLYIVNLQASGKINKVEFFLRSQKGKVVEIDLGNVKPQAKPTKAITDETEFLPLANIEKESIQKALKTNYLTVPVKLNESEDFILYTSVPYGYNNKNTNMTFEHVKLIGDKKDTVAIDEIFTENDYFDIGSSNSSGNLRAVRFSPKNMKPTKIIGDIDFGITNYYDKEYPINRLPKGLIIAPDGVTLTIFKNEPSLEDVSAIYAFTKEDKKHALSTVRIENYDYDSENSLLQYVKKPAYIIVRYKKDKDKRVEEKVPFELNIPKPKKE